MLGKLLKHEFKATARLFIPIFIMVTAISVAVRFLVDILYDINNGGTQAGEIFSMIIAFIFGAALVIGMICLILSGPAVSLYRNSPRYSKASHIPTRAILQTHFL